MSERSSAQPLSGHVRAGDGVRIAWRDDGPPGATPVFFCTMATAAMPVWDPLVRTLEGRWRLIRHDRRGDGESDPGAPESHSFEGYVADAFAVLDQLEIERAFVCGMAFGARVAMRMALAQPDRVIGLALYDATGGLAAPEAERRAGNVEAARRRAEAGFVDPVRDTRWFERRDLTGAGLSRHAFVGHPDWLPGLAGIRAPTLVACGEHDPNLPGSRRLAAEIPGARFELMAMTGHASILERPDLVASLLADFVAARDPGSAETPPR